ncbi:hypothetical protein [Flavobacterium sp.]|uniref:hypothetical protein n=1 Tax=Flavobacterium sp. TaxID=239 RepID=UPI00261D2FA2|nr:hypothetical protein [Flavobacterium sp.]
MRNLTILFLILFTSNSFSQIECEFDSDINDTSGTYKNTKDYVMHERYFGNNKATLFFSLVNADGLISLNVQYIQKNSDFISAKCLDKNSKVYVQLANGKVITLLGIEQENCGNLIRNENENIRFISGYFLFMKDSYEELKKSPIEIIRVKFAGEMQDFIIKSELISELDGKTYKPENYFINYLKCVE